MAVKIRLAPRDGRFIEKIGTYDPNTNPASINFDGEKAFAWIMKGAEPTDTVRAMLSYRGVLYRKHLQLGVIKGAISQETADERFTSWKEQKDAKIEGKRTNIGTAKDEARKAALAAESKVKEARAEAIRKKNTPAPTEAPAAEGETTEAEAPAETTEEAGA